MGLGESGITAAVCVQHACTCVQCYVGSRALSGGVGWGCWRESGAGLYRTCLARAGGAGWGSQEPFQVSRGNMSVGCTCVYLCSSVLVDLEGTCASPLL